MTKYFCDKCGKELASNEEWSLSGPLGFRRRDFCTACIFKAELFTLSEKERSL